MTELQYFDALKDRSSFTTQEILYSFRKGGFALSDASFYKILSKMVKEGKLIRAGRGTYCFRNIDIKQYEHEYSDLAVEVAGLIYEQFPLVNFSVIELIQLNDFVNHQIAHNALFVSVEADVMDFVFDALRDKYFGKVFINPPKEIYHQYWSDDMIIINKLVTESPRCSDISWHTRIEKLLVDVIAEPLLLESISESEYPNIYEGAFSMYAIDESCLFRYASRRTVDKKINRLITEKTNIKLLTKRRKRNAASRELF